MCVCGRVRAGVLARARARARTCEQARRVVHISDSPSHPHTHPHSPAGPSLLCRDAHATRAAARRAPPIGRGAAVILQLHTLTRAAVKQCLYFQTRWNRVPRHLRLVWKGGWGGGGRGGGEEKGRFNPRGQSRAVLINFHRIRKARRLKERLLRAHASVARIVGFAGVAPKAEVAMLATDKNGPDLST